MSIQYIYQHRPLQAAPEFTQIGIFGLQIKPSGNPGTRGFDIHYLSRPLFPGHLSIKKKIRFKYFSKIGFLKSSLDVFGLIDIYSEGSSPGKCQKIQRCQMHSCLPMHTNHLLIRGLPRSVSNQHGLVFLYENYSDYILCMSRVTR
jgi:hypothetical protein